MTTSAPELDARLRLWRNYGSRVKYVHELPGWNSRLEELQAAFLSARLAHLETDNRARSQVARSYKSLLADIPGIRLPVVPEDAQPVWHLFPVLCDDRAAVQGSLAKAGIATLVHYPVPIHRQACLSRLSSLNLPGAQDWCDRTLSLPIHPLLAQAEIERVAEVLAGR